MPLSIFADALPYNEVIKNYIGWLPDMQVSELLPNIAYSSSLHWQLYCDKYPDDRGILVDWVNEPEKKNSVRVLSTLLSPLDSIGSCPLYVKKILDRAVYHRNEFANIPFRFRKDFTEKGKYLFWDKDTYSKELIFSGYEVVSQDEGHISFQEVCKKGYAAIEKGNPNIFFVSGFADTQGHRCKRGELYSARIRPYMDELQKLIFAYLKKYPKEEILLVSDHGMSTVENHIDLQLDNKFGKQSKKNYVAYSDTAVMCIWVFRDDLKNRLAEYLKTREEGHLLTDDERKFFRATDKRFGDLIYILREGNVFSDSWFGKSIRHVPKDGQGMHGFWPERVAHDQMACVILANSNRKLGTEYDYPSVHKIICQVMQGKDTL